MNEKKTCQLSSPICFYIAGGIFLIYALIFPFYRPGHYLIAGLLSAAGYFISARLLPKQTVELEEAPAATGDALADQAVTEGRGYLKQLSAIRAGISDAGVKASLSSIDTTVGRILSAIQDQPKKAPMVRRLLSYYLPTLIKLAGFYEKLEQQGGEGDNIADSMRRIEGNLTSLDGALKKQLDLLYENDALDISTDITVMENMLSREGLSGGNDRL